MLRVAALCALGARADVVPFNVDYASFLARADPIWRFTNTSSRTPTEWVDSLFGGSGDTGVLILGVRNATSRIPDGKQVAVDGVAGIVRWMA